MWVCALIIAVTVAIVTVGEAVIARHRAGQVADLAALAGAAAWAQTGDPCLAADELVRRSGAALVGCVPEMDQSLLVIVEVSAGSHLPPARARARAGPASNGPAVAAPREA